MEGLTEIPEKMTRVEFDELYNKALSRIMERDKRAVLKSLEAPVRAQVREELASLGLMKKGKT